MIQFAIVVQWLQNESRTQKKSKCHFLCDSNAIWIYFVEQIVSAMQNDNLMISENAAKSKQKYKCGTLENCIPLDDDFKQMNAVELWIDF